MADEKLAAGFTCQKCDTFHKYDVYMYAHWHIKLLITCGCGWMYVIYEGNEKLISRGATPKKVKA